MKIISLGPAHPLRGGIADFNETLISQLLKNGEKCSIYSYSLQYPAFLFPGKTQCRTDSAPTNIEIKTTVNSINPLNWYSVGKAISKKNPDILITHFWMPFFSPAIGTISRLVRKNKHTKVIAICHNIVPHESAFYDRMLTKYFIANTDGFVCLAKSVLDDLTRFSVTKNKIFTPHPIYDIYGAPIDKKEAKKKLGLEQSVSYMLFFGLVRRYKGLDLLLHSFARLKEPNVKLLVAGEFYDDPVYYSNIIKKYKLEEKVVIHDKFIRNEDVKLYFSAADIVTQTYNTATQSGISQIAYSFDKPMLVTDVGGLSEIVPHGKVGYVVPKDPDKIADSLSDFFKNKRENEYSLNANIEKQRFSWQKMVDEINVLYQSF